jgi:hypothetical protein
MSLPLSSLLVQEGLIDPKRVAEALKRQVIYGGTLDTILLELDAIEEPVLLDALGRSSGLPIAGDLPSSELLRAIEAPSWFPSTLSERFRALPVVVDGNVLRVLVTDPPDRRQLDELGYLLSRSIEPIIVPEYRFAHAAAVIYGMEVSARFASLQARLMRKEVERGRSAPVSPMPTAVSLAPPPRGVPPLPREGFPAPDVDQTPAIGPTSEGEKSSAISVEAAKARLEAATVREDVFEALCRGARSLLDFAALFTVQAEVAIARMAIGTHWIERDELEKTRIALDRSSPFRSTVQSRAPYIGKIGEEPISIEVLSALGRPGPTAGLLMPVVLRERTVAFVYGDFNTHPIDGKTVSDLADLVAAASRTFQRLILQAKSADAESPAVDPAPESIDRLILSIVRGDSQAARSTNALLSLGEVGAEALVARIPGPLRLDRHLLRGSTPKLEQHGPLLALLPRFGSRVIEPLLRRSSDAAPDVRFYAVLALGEIAGAEALEALGLRLFDEDAGVRKVATEALRNQPPSEAVRRLLESLRAGLSDPDPSRRRLIVDCLGGLRDLPSIPMLIELVEYSDDELAEVARRSLIHLCKQDFGASRWRWRSWWEKHREQSRVEWLLEGLGHPEVWVRQSAFDELQQIAPESFGYQVDHPRPEREDARDRFIAWWNNHGQHATRQS